MKQMELSTEVEKHKKTQSELDGCSMMGLTRSEKGSEYSCGGEDEAVREDRYTDGELLPKGSLQRV